MPMACDEIPALSAIIPLGYVMNPLGYVMNPLGYVMNHVSTWIDPAFPHQFLKGFERSEEL